MATLSEAHTAAIETARLELRRLFARRRAGQHDARDAASVAAAARRLSGLGAASVYWAELARLRRSERGDDPAG